MNSAIHRSLYSFCPAADDLLSESLRGGLPCTCRIRSYRVECPGALVESSEQRVVVDDIPDAIVPLLEPDRFAVERLTQEVLAGVETERTGVADTAHLEVARIFRRGDAFGIRTRGRGPAGRWRLVIERFVGPQLILRPLKRVEHPLCEMAIRCG